MKIVFDARFLYTGGVHPHSRLVHVFLIWNRRNPCRASILLYIDLKQDREALLVRYGAPNLEIRSFGSASGRIRRLLWLWRSVPRMLRADRADVFYSSFYFLPPRVRGVRLVNTIHDCCVFYIPPQMNRGLLSSPVYLWVLKRFMKWTNLRADKTLTVSHFSKKMLVRHLGLPAARIGVCYHGLDEGQPRSGEVIRPTAEPYFLFVGSNLPKKNIRHCLEGYARLPEAIRNVYKLRLKTGCYPEDRKVIERLNLGSRVEFIDSRLSDDEVSSLYRNASLLLLLSYDEGFGLPIIESFEARVPVLVSNRAACDELVPMPECKADPDDTLEIAAKWEALTLDGALRSKCIAIQDDLLPQFTISTAASCFYHELSCDLACGADSNLNEGKDPKAKHLGVNRYV